MTKTVVPAAENHGLPAAEFVRERILAISRNRSDAAAVPADLAPLIERTFHRFATTVLGRAA